LEVAEVSPEANTLNATEDLLNNVFGGSGDYANAIVELWKDTISWTKRGKRLVYCHRLKKKKEKSRPKRKKRGHESVTRSRRPGERQEFISIDGIASMIFQSEGPKRSTKNSEVVETKNT